MTTSVGGKISIRKQNNVFLPQLVESTSQEGIFRLFLIHTIVIPRRMLQHSERLRHLPLCWRLLTFLRWGSISIRSWWSLVSNMVSFHAWIVTVITKIINQQWSANDFSPWNNNTNICNSGTMTDITNSYITPEDHRVERTDLVKLLISLVKTLAGRRQYIYNGIPSFRTSKVNENWFEESGSLRNWG